MTTYTITGGPPAGGLESTTSARRGLCISENSICDAVQVVNSSIPAGAAIQASFHAYQGKMTVPPDLLHWEYSLTQSAMADTYEAAGVVQGNCRRSSAAYSIISRVNRTRLKLAAPNLPHAYVQVPPSYQPSAKDPSFAADNNFCASTNSNIRSYLSAVTHPSYVLPKSFKSHVVGALKAGLCMIGIDRKTDMIYCQKIIMAGGTHPISSDESILRAAPLILFFSIPPTIPFPSVPISYAIMNQEPSIARPLPSLHTPSADVDQVKSPNHRIAPHESSHNPANRSSTYGIPFRVHPAPRPRNPELNCIDSEQ
ncbi:hypothetical protein C8R46DRAFT_1186027 [Mycena filopes]|nr:hypothetical protein C8R46DRAFT_1186027 [Mycena filopes]